MLAAIAIPLLYNFILPEHAKKRIDIFLHPESDPRGAGYNIIQSKISYWSRWVNWNGIIKRKSNPIRIFISQNNGFYFSVIGEEMGFIVAGAIIILYVVFITKILYIAKTAKDSTGTLIAAGISGIFIFHMIENIGMVMGLLPITGVPFAIYKLWWKFNDYKII